MSIVEMMNYISEGVVHWFIFIFFNRLHETTEDDQPLPQSVATVCVYIYIYMDIYMIASVGQLYFGNANSNRVSANKHKLQQFTPGKISCP